MIAPVIAVYGNIDGTPIRSRYPGHQRHTRDGLDIWMTHIGGYPGNYDPRVKPAIYDNPPGLFISGHSHILKVMPDKKDGFLHMNPGSAGRNGIAQGQNTDPFRIVKGGWIMQMSLNWDRVPRAPLLIEIVSPRIQGNGL